MDEIIKDIGWEFSTTLTSADNEAVLKMIANKICASLIHVVSYQM